MYQCLEETEYAACGQLSTDELEGEILRDDSYKPNELDDIQHEKDKATTVIELEWCSIADLLNVADNVDNESTEVSEIVYEPFLSSTTMNGLRVTILSTIDVVNFLLDSGYKYVLTGKLNQDCIEVNIY